MIDATKRVHTCISELRNQHQPKGEPVQNDTKWYKMSASDMPLGCFYFCFCSVGPLSLKKSGKNQEDHLDQSKVNGHFRLLGDWVCIGHRAQRNAATMGSIQPFAESISLVGTRTPIWICRLFHMRICWCANWSNNCPLESLALD